MRRFLCPMLILFLVGAASLAWMHVQARRDPVVRRAAVSLPDWPADERPVRVLLKLISLGPPSPLMCTAAKPRRRSGSAGPTRRPLGELVGELSSA